MATKTRNTKKTAPKRKATRRKQTNTDSALNALAKKVRKDPKAATKAERKKVVEAGLVMAGLRGKARTLFIDKGEEPKETVAKAPKPKVTAKRTGAMPIHDALHSALAKGAMEQAALVEKVEALRGRPTPAGTVRPYLKDSEAYRQNKDGKWTLA